MKLQVLARSSGFILLQLSLWILRVNPEGRDSRESGRHCQTQGNGEQVRSMWEGQLAITAMPPWAVSAVLSKPQYLAH